MAAVGIVTRRRESEQTGNPELQQKSQIGKFLDSRPKIFPKSCASRHEVVALNDSLYPSGAPAEIKNAFRAGRVQLAEISTGAILGMTARKQVQRPNLLTLIAIRLLTMQKSEQPNA